MGNFNLNKNKKDGWFKQKASLAKNRQEDQVEECQAH